MANATRVVLTAEEKGCVRVNQHPIAQIALGIMRNKETSYDVFRYNMKLCGMILGIDALSELKLRGAETETPLTKTTVAVLDGLPPVLAPILRAGLGLADGVELIMSKTTTAHIGYYRDHRTYEPIRYLFKHPPVLKDRMVVVIDPMLATAGTAIKATSDLKGAGATNLIFLCLLAAPEGIRAFLEAHPDVPIVTAAIDSHLDENRYIVPGLGDAGDRQSDT